MIWIGVIKDRLGFFTFDDPSAFRTVMFADFGKSGTK